MNKAFELILKRLRNLAENYGRLQFGFNDSCEIQKYVGMEQALDLAIETVQEVAEEYKKDNYFNLDHVTLHKCPKCGGNAQHRVNQKGSWACGCFECGLFKSDYDHQKAIQEWEDYCKEYNNGWIPCGERLPEDRDWYLAVFEEIDTGFIGLPYIAEYLMGAHTKYTTNDGWILHNCTDMEGGAEEYYKNLRCVAWQPLPEPYKESET